MLAIFRSPIHVTSRVHHVDPTVAQKFYLCTGLYNCIISGKNEQNSNAKNRVLTHKYRILQRSLLARKLVLL
jgi:hypothetical protein